jgi:hypothetical protein
LKEFENRIVLNTIDGLSLDGGIKILENDSLKKIDDLEDLYPNEI